MCIQFQHFGDFDRTNVGGPTRLDQWTGKVKKHYNAFVNHANRVLPLLQYGSRSDARVMTVKSELIRAIDEIKLLARLRLYELSCIEEKFDVNGDGPGNADFICYNACEFLHAAYTARTEFVVWTCLATRFKCVVQPKDVISSTAPTLSNRSTDDRAWHTFCCIVEDMLHDDAFADHVLGNDAHSQFLASNDERLYDFQQDWIPEPRPGSINWCAPIFPDSPDYGYQGSFRRDGVDTESVLRT